MHDSIDVSWTDRWEALFGYGFGGDNGIARGKAFLEEVAAFPYVGQVTEPEMIAALRSYAEGERKEGRRPKAPTAGQVATLVKRSRWESRQAAQGGSEEAQPVRVNRNGPTRPDGHIPVITETRTLGSLRADMLYASPAERWEIVCSAIGFDPDKRPWTDRLLQLAMAMPGGVERYEPDANGTAQLDAGGAIGA